MADLQQFARDNAAAWIELPDVSRDYIAFIDKTAPQAQQLILRDTFRRVWEEWRERYPPSGNFFSSVVGWFGSNARFLAYALVATFVLALIAQPLLSGDYVRSLADPSYARGLITYLFAVGTIGVILILVFFVISSDGSFDEKRFQPAKDILVILIGIFGTILGFYFGTQTLEGARALQIEELAAEPAELASGGTLTITGVIRGGESPYSYSVEFAATPADAFMAAGLNAAGLKSEKGAVQLTRTIPADAKAASLTYQLIARDADGRAVVRSAVAPIAVKGPG